MGTTVGLQALRAFRVDLYGCFGHRADALFELADALLSSGAVPSLPHMSLQAAHRRGWGSAYAALAVGEVDADALRAVLAARPLAGGQSIYAVDVSAWPRCDAEASPERGYSYHPSRHSAGKPIVAGWAYRWVAQLSLDRDSWTAPLDVRRVHPTENANAVAIEQARTLAGRLPGGDVPLFVFDAGYDSVPLTQGLSDLPVAVPVRLRSGRCFYADPPVVAPSPPGGRPRKHGAKFDCGDSTTWPKPTAEPAVEDAQYGGVRVRAWSGLDPKQQNHATRGTRKPRAVVRGTVVPVEVGRLPARPYPPQVLRLWWAGPGAPDLDVLWRAYVRRFDLEHTLRFCKQSLGWTTPRPRHPEQADRWTWLVVGVYTRLRLSRARVADRRLPRERPLDPDRLTPYRPRSPHAVPSPPRPYGIAAAPRHAGRRAETVRPIARPAQGPPFRARDALPGPQEDGLTRPMR